MATQREEGAIPDFLVMEGPKGEGWNAGHSGQGDWNGWPSKDLKAATLVDEEGRVRRVRAPVTELEGLITPTELHYVVQHFAVPDVVPAEKWALSVSGEVKRPLDLNFEELRRFPGRTVRTVMECSGSDATYFEYFKGVGPKPSRTNECMILSASEWTGVPLAAILNEAGLTGRATHIRDEGWDQGVPASAKAGTEPFFYDKGLSLEKALHPDTILAVAQNGQLLEHLHGSPVRLLVPGWSGNWSVKWLWKLEVMDHEPDCWYHYNFYYYGDSPDDPNKELITTLGVKSIVTHPNDNTETLPKGTHVVRGYAWSGAGTISQVEVSLDGGETWHAARMEEPIDRWMWVRWSYLWDAQKSGQYKVMSRATDAAGRVQSMEPRYNNMRKNFSAVVGYDIVID
ncbi:MAG: molybdopterin-dependent oxidoreductase [Chloroflexi bacterium]|nr:molybdopterin-dependent oxidoreductase [Chloroflexota bacterium]